MKNTVDKSKYTVVEKPIKMKSQISKVVHFTPKLTEEEYMQVKKAIGSELYDIFKKYV